MPRASDEVARPLTEAQVGRFIRDGFVRVERAFPRELADEGRKILWRDTGCDPHDASTWTRPVIRLGWYDQKPFREAANSPVLHAAFDRLVGEGRWLPRDSLGSFPVAFRARMIRATPAGTSIPEALDEGSSTSPEPASESTWQRVERSRAARTQS